ncbi:MAG TPA: helix-turn-helix domain-containing protein [Phototrophicaceae bacterium]|nr:helix-turn-helix domain-containing protein [Phototrophicaceae bacterium]
MSIVLFLIGVVLFYTSKFSFGGLKTQGRHVKAAGLVLMSPAAFTFLLSLFAVPLFVRSDELLGVLLNVMALVEISLVILSMMITYILIANPRNAPQLPGILGLIQRERQNESASTSPAAPGRRVATPPPVRTPEPFPSIMTVAQAAIYLNMAEAEILTLIEGNKLAAARINYTYRIAKSVLDDLRQSQQANA